MDAWHDWWNSSRFLNMRIGIIAEGKADCAVITNILTAKLKINRDDITYIRPNLFNDETDLSPKKKFIGMNPDDFSSWSLVKKECEERINFSKFFDYIDEERYMIVHLDTDTVGEFGITKPVKIGNVNYVELLRNLVIEKINEWLENDYVDKIKYAIAIEEIEAWILCIYLNTRNTSQFENVKKKLIAHLNKHLSKKEKSSFILDEFKKYLIWSGDMNKENRLNQFLKNNKSLELFCNSLREIKK
jgi:hypothetical protein